MNKANKATKASKTNRTNKTKQIKQITTVQELRDLEKRIRELSQVQDELIRQIDVINEFVIEEEEQRDDLDVRVSGYKVFKPCFKVSIPVERFV